MLASSREKQIARTKSHLSNFTFLQSFCTIFTEYGKLPSNKENRSMLLSYLAFFEKASNCVIRLASSALHAEKNYGKAIRITYVKDPVIVSTGWCFFNFLNSDR